MRLDPLNINIDIIQNKNESFTDIRKVSLNGSDKWKSRLINMHV